MRDTSSNASTKRFREKATNARSYYYNLIEKFVQNNHLRVQNFHNNLCTNRQVYAFFKFDKATTSNVKRRRAQNAREILLKNMYRCI